MNVLVNIAMADRHARMLKINHAGRSAHARLDLESRVAAESY